MIKLKKSFIVATIGLAACSSTMMVKVPPRMMLDRNQTVGIIAFDVEGSPDGDHNVTGKFMEAIQEEQPGVAILELGSLSTVLKEVKHPSLTADAVKAIGKQFNVDGVISGQMAMKQSKPNVDVDLSQGLKLDSVKAQIRLDGTLNAKLMTTSRGATVWTGSSSMWINLANVGGTGMGTGSFSFADRGRQVEKLINGMIRSATRDFQSTWERQPKKK
jgi:hypothetical protein